MSLVIDLQITGYDGSLKDIDRLIIRRLEPLDDPYEPDDEVHTYEASTRLGQHTAPVQLKHRYGDGAWKLTQLAIEAIANGKDVSEIKTE